MEDKETTGAAVAELEEKDVESNVRVPRTASPALEKKLKAGRKIRGRAVRNTQKHGFDVAGVRGHLQAGHVYEFPYEVFLVLNEAGYVEEYGGK